MEAKSYYKEIRFKRKNKRYFFIDCSGARISEIDAYKVLWNGHYVNYFEQARIELCKTKGFNMNTLEDLGFYLPVYHYNIYIKAPVLANESFSIGVRPREFSESSFMFEHVLMVNNEVRAYGEVQHVAVDKQTKQMVFSIPEEVASIMRPIIEDF